MQEAAFRPGMNGKHRKYDTREQYQVRLFRPPCPPRPPSSALVRRVRRVLESGQYLNMPIISK